MSKRQKESPKRIKPKDELRMLVKLPFPCLTSPRAFIFDNFDSTFATLGRDFNEDASICFKAEMRVTVLKISILSLWMASFLIAAGARSSVNSKVEVRSAPGQRGT